jgi:acetolactate synthase I/II/III large subunit
MKGSELLVRCLENEGVRYIFGVPGEETLDVLKALASSRQITMVTTQHVQSAAFMANVYGRLSPVPGVCLAVPGPDAGSLATGLTAAFYDRVPLVAITGQAAPSGGRKDSQQQDIDMVRRLASMTRWNTRIERPGSIPDIVRKAFHLARLEKPGPTHIAMPTSVATAPVAATPRPTRRITYPPAFPESIAQAVDLLRTSERPVVLVGNGVLRRQATGRQVTDRLVSFVHRLGIPVVPTFMGKGTVDYRDSLAQPAVGLHAQGVRGSALAKADVVLAIGYDLAEWHAKAWNGKRDKTIIHIDSMAAEVDNHYLPAVEVVGEIDESLWAMECLGDFRSQRWLAGIHRRDALDLLALHQMEASFPYKPQRVVAELRNALGDTDMLITDVGVHTLWLATLFPATCANSVVIANGLASLGLAVPGALAAKLVHPERKVVAVTGESGFLKHAQELATARRLGTAFVTIVWREQPSGVLARDQQRRCGRTFAPAGTHLDLVKYVEAFGLPGFRVERPDSLLPILKRALDYNRPSLVEVPIDPTVHHELGHVHLDLMPQLRPVVAA